MAGVVSTFVMPRSAFGNTTVIGSLAVLFVRSKSTSPLAVTDAVATIGFGVGTVLGAIARIPTSTRLPGGMVPPVQVTVGATVHVPSVESAAITVTPAGRVAVSAMSGTAAGPRLASVSA